MPAQPGHHGTRVPGQRRSQRSDRLLYPDLLNHKTFTPSVRWWQHTRHALAESLADPALVSFQRREVQTAGIRRYQNELAHRSRQALINRVRDGWWLGPPPHGYALAHHRIQDERGRSVWRHRLVVDQRRAPNVPVLFGWFGREGLPEADILARLLADPDQYPLPVDPVKGRPRPWTSARIRTVLTNPAYLGYVVWGRTLRGQPLPPDAWICSPRPSHPALVEPALFWAAYHRLHPQHTEPAVRPRST